MGLSLNEVAILADWTARHRLGGHVATLGVPALHFSAAELAGVLRDAAPEAADRPPLNATDLYRRLGFSRASYVDVSDYEGADVILDLGAPAIAAELDGAFDLVFDCGTLEHVFHLPNALRNVVRMTATGGHVLHLVLMDNGVDHGFYQISPTLFFDWFEAAGLEVLEAAALGFDAADFRASDWSVRHVRRGTFGGGELGVQRGRTSLFMVLARKTGDLTDGPTPIQYFYRSNRGMSRVNPRWFPAFRLRSGLVLNEMPSTRMDIKDIMADKGFAWCCELPAAVPAGSDGEDRCRSDLLLLEDGHPLGPMNWAHAAVSGTGGGAYCHWERSLFFSASDNSSPLANGRRYEVLFASRPNTGQGT